jgi:hypothetical protein
MVAGAVALRCSYFRSPFVRTARLATPLREYLCAWLVIAALLAASFWPLLFGQSIGSADALRALDSVYVGEPQAPLLLPRAALRLYDLLRNPLVDEGIYDPAFYWIDLPNSALEAAYFQRGEWPIWNPYVGLGTPLLATGQTGSFFPLKLILYLGRVVEAYSAYLVARLFLAGAFAYAFARLIALGHWSALTASSAYMLGGFLTMHFHNVEATTASVLPFLLWAFEHLARRRDAPSLAMAALATAAIGSAGHPEPALYGVAGGGAYFLARAQALGGGTPKMRVRAARLCADSALLLSAGGLGALCAAVLVLPFAERAAMAASGLLSRVDPASLASAAHQVFIPLLLHFFLPLAQPQPQFNAYAGPSALMLVFIAVRSRRDHDPVSSAVSPLLVMVSASLGSLLVSRGSELLPVLPFGIHGIYAVPALSFSVSMLAGIGAHHLARTAATDAQTAARLLAPGLVLALAGALAIWDASQDEQRAPGLLALAPVVLVILFAGFAGFAAARGMARRTAGAYRGASAAPGQIEVVCAAAGAALVAGAVLTHVSDVAYREWVGQAARGTVTSAASTADRAVAIPETWSARGWVATGEWKINRGGREALLMLGPVGPHSFEWYEGPKLGATNLVTSNGGHLLAFDAGGERYDARVTGGFHRFVSPEAAGRLVVELGIAAALLCGVLVIPAIGWVGSRAARRALDGAAFLLTAVPLVLIAFSRNPPQSHFSFPATGAVTSLRLALDGSPFERAAPVGHRVLMPNSNILLGIRSTSLQDPLQSCRYQQVMAVLSARGPEPAEPAALTTPACTGQHQTDLLRLSDRALHVLGSAVAISTAADSTGEPGEPGLRSVGSIDAVRLYRADPPARRATLPATALPFSHDDPAVLTHLSDPAFDPSRTALVETDGTGTAAISPLAGRSLPCRADDSRVQAALRGGLDRAGEGFAHILDESGTQMRVALRAAHPGFLVVADTHYPGWIAFLDGSPVPLCRANGLMRAVPVPAGEHTVIFRYAPLTFAVGLGLTLTGYGIAAVLLTLGVLQQRRSAERQQSTLARGVDHIPAVASAILGLNLLMLAGFWLGLPA